MCTNRRPFKLAMQHYFLTCPRGGPSQSGSGPPCCRRLALRSPLRRQLRLAAGSAAPGRRPRLPPRPCLPRPARPGPPVGSGICVAKMVIWKFFLAVCVICMVVHVASPLVLASVGNADNGLSYEEQRLEIERQRADAERQRADAAELKWDEENSRRSRICAKCHNFSEILPQARSLADSLPRDAFVPHIRSLEEFPDDPNARGGEYLAITAASNYEEREKAAAELKKYQPTFRTSNMSTDPRLQEASYAYQDRGESNDIVFAPDFVWGIERVRDREEALFATTIKIAHERANEKSTDSTPENVCLKDAVCNFLLKIFPPFTSLLHASGRQYGRRNW
jgi:hypothetical protein